MVYGPKEDSYFLSEILEEYINEIPEKERKNLKALDMGTGSGIQAETLLENGLKRENIVCADIDEKAIDEIGAKFKTIKTDLFSNIDQKFDIIVFNPPYLPEDEYDKERDTSGGKNGDETIINFLRDAQKYLNKEGKIILLLSSLTPRYKINKVLERKGMAKKKIAEKLLFFESLEIFEITIS